MGYNDIYACEIYYYNDYSGYYKNHMYRYSAFSAYEVTCKLHDLIINDIELKLFNNVKRMIRNMPDIELKYKLFDSLLRFECKTGGIPYEILVLMCPKLGFVGSYICAYLRRQQMRLPRPIIEIILKKYYKIQN